MKRTIILFAAAAMVAGCSKSDNVLSTTNAPGEVIITASVGEVTKMTFSDEGAAGVKTAWESTDGFTLYDASGNRAAGFKLTGGTGLPVGAFRCADGTVIAGTQYTAVYPASTAATLTARVLARSINGTTQSGNNSMAHLSNVCYMRAPYTHNTGNSVAFAMEYALMTIKIDKPTGYDAATHGVPTSLIFVNGSTSYTLNLTGLSGFDFTTPLVAYMMVDAAPATGRTLRFELHCGDYIFVKEVTSTKLYEAGKRYTADLSGANVLALAGGPLSSFSATNYPAGDTWIITDAIDASTDLSGLQAALNAVSIAGGRQISVVMPNAVAVPTSAFDTYGGLNMSCLVSVDAPLVETIGDYAFWSCGNLQTVRLPVATTIGEGAFEICSSLQAITLPVATTIGDYAFENCSNLQTVTLPVAKTIGDQAFEVCPNLQTISLPEATTIGDYAFNNCYNLQTISLPMATTIGSQAFYNCSALTRLEIATAPGAAALTSVGTNLFAYTVATIDLVLGANEYNSANVNVTAKTWWGYGPFKSITSM